MLKRSLLLMPARTELYQAKLGVYLLIASLAMFFGASLITYVTIRLAHSPEPLPGSAAALGGSDQLAVNQTAAASEIPLATFRGRHSPYVDQQLDLEPLVVPKVLLFSTVLLIGISIFLHLAVVRVAQERQQAFRRHLVGAAVLAVLFMALQTYGLIDLIGNHRRTDDGQTKMYGIAFTLAFIHALHIYGGFIFLGAVVANSMRNKFDHERHWSVDICASYWHFLDIVWIAMLATFLITG